MQQICYICIVRNDKSVLFSMKTSELLKRLQKAGCFMVRHGKRHDIWHSPITGNDCSVPRHGAKEIPPGTLKSIEKDLLGI